MPGKEAKIHEFLTPATEIICIRAFNLGLTMSKESYMQSRLQARKDFGLRYDADRLAECAHNLARKQQEMHDLNVQLLTEHLAKMKNPDRKARALETIKNLRRQMNHDPHD